MATTSAGNPPGMISDANVLIARFAKETDKYSAADAELVRYARAGYRFYAPDVIVAECLYVLSKKREDGGLSAADHAHAVADLWTDLGMILPPPRGDGMLAARAEQIRGGFGCSRSADGL